MDGADRGAAGAGMRPPAVQTEGTAPPEGGRPASGAAMAPVRQWPLLVVMCGVALGLLITLASFRPGLLTIGGFVLVGGVLRMAVRQVGMLAVRSRFTDLITFGVLGLGIITLALMVPPNPILEISWLTDVVRFAVR